MPQAAQPAGPPKRACVYVRMSTDKQEDSPERQRGQIDPHCQRRGYVVVRRYEDLGERGWSDERQGFNQMLEDAGKGLFDVIVVDEMSRLSRSDQWAFMETVLPLRRAGVLVDSVAEGLMDWNDPNDLSPFIMLGVRQHKSNQESSNLGRRVLSGYEKLAAKGKILLGRAPYGYRRQRDAGGATRLVLGPDDEVRTVRWIFDAYVNRDYSYADIVRELNRRAVSPPAGGSGWCRPTVAGILKAEVYTGSYVFNRRHYGKFFRMTAAGPEQSRRDRQRIKYMGVERSPRSVANDRKDWVVIPNTHEPIIEPELFNRVQGVIKSNTRRTTPVKCRGDFLLSGLLVCEDCGRPMLGGRAAPTQKVRERYMCSGRQNVKSDCKLNIVREPEVLDRILGTLKQTFMNPQVVVARLRAQARRDGRSGPGPPTGSPPCGPRSADLSQEGRQGQEEPRHPGRGPRARKWSPKSAPGRPAGPRSRPTSSDVRPADLRRGRQRPRRVRPGHALGVRGGLQGGRPGPADGPSSGPSSPRWWSASTPSPTAREFRYRLVGGVGHPEAGPPLAHADRRQPRASPGHGPNSNRCWDLDSAGTCTGQVRTEWCLPARRAGSGCRTT
jgi:DNA invertase Pin-like site-specific DNA recombinase